MSDNEFGGPDSSGEDGGNDSDGFDALNTGTIRPHETALR